MAVLRYNASQNPTSLGVKEIQFTLPPSKSLLIRRIFIQTALGIRDSSNPTEDFNSWSTWQSQGGDDIQSALRLTSAIRNTSSDPQVWEAGEAGTVMRFGLALLVFSGKTGIIQGRGRAHDRPIGGLVEALRHLGARIEYLEREGYPPLQVEASSMQGGRVNLPSTISSQFASAILLGGLCKDVSLELTWGTSELSSRPYLDMTLAMLDQVGCLIQRGSNGVRINTRTSKKMPDLVEGDWSAAAFWILRQAALPLVPELVLSPVKEDTLQGDALLYRWLPWLAPEMKVTLTAKNSADENRLCLEHRLSRLPSQARMPTLQFNSNSNPLPEWDCRGDLWICRAGAVPDLVPALAVWAVLRGVKLEIRGIGHLVYKESNRLEAITDNLKGIGIDCRILSKEKTTEKHDNLAPDAVLQILPTQAWVDHVQQRGREQRLKFRSFQDHRMVMAMSMLALPGWELEFDDAGVVTKSYPLFWEHWKILGYELTP